MSNNRRYSTIYLGYFKQGDDLDGCKAHNDDGTLNVKQSFMNHIDLLQGAIDRLREICDTIPDINDCDLDAGTHHIGLSGEAKVINALVEKGLVSIDEYLEEEMLEEQNESQHGTDSEDTEILDQDDEQHETDSEDSQSLDPADNSSEEFTPN